MSRLFHRVNVAWKVFPYLVTVSKCENSKKTPRMKICPTFSAPYLVISVTRPTSLSGFTTRTKVGVISVSKVNHDEKTKRGRYLDLARRYQREYSSCYSHFVRLARFDESKTEASNGTHYLKV